MHCSTTAVHLPSAKLYFGCGKRTKWLVILALLLPTISIFVPAIGASSTTRRMDEQRDREKEVLYKCYKNVFHPTEHQQEPCLSRAEYCVGKMCVTQYPTDILADKSVPVRRSCLNETALTVKPGTCESLSDGVPGGIDRVCACIGNFCNGAVSSQALTAFSATIYRLSLSSSLLFSIIMYLF